MLDEEDGWERMMGSTSLLACLCEIGVASRLQYCLSSFSIIAQFPFNFL